MPEIFLYKDSDYRLKMYCRELAPLSPQLCGNTVAREKCLEMCMEDKTTPGKM